MSRIKTSQSASPCSSLRMNSFRDLEDMCDKITNPKILENLMTVRAGFLVMDAVSPAQRFGCNMQEVMKLIPGREFISKDEKDQKFIPVKRRCIYRLRSIMPPLFTFTFIACIIMLMNGHRVINKTAAKSHLSHFTPKPNKVGNSINECRTLERQVDGIQLHVIGWARHESMDTLLQQLEGADYSGWHNVTLYIHLDGKSTKEKEIGNVATLFDWTHGQKIIKKQKENIGLRSMWLDSIGTAAREAGDNTLLVVFEDDIRVSPAYFQWLLTMIDRYARNPTCRDPNLVGFSLSPILLQEMSKPFKRWDAREAMGNRYQKNNRDIAYLTTVPSSWGAAYWSNHWNDFDNFARLRMQPPFYDIEAEDAKDITDYSQFRMSPQELHIPGARANVWPKSWKRFMIDFMYARGSVMMYPNFPGKKGLATTLQLAGEHVVERNKKDPRLANLLDPLDLHTMDTLPQYGDLAVFGLNLLLSTREELVLKGSKFLHSIREKWHSLTYQDQLFEDLVTQWAQPGFDFSRSNDE